MVLSASSIFCSTKWVCSFSSHPALHSLIRQVVRIPRKWGTISPYYWLLEADLRCQRTVVAFIFMNDTFQSAAYVILPGRLFLPDSPLSPAWFTWLGSTGNAIWFGISLSELILFSANNFTSSNSVMFSMSSAPELILYVSHLHFQTFTGRTRTFPSVPRSPPLLRTFSWHTGL